MNRFVQAITVGHTIFMIYFLAWIFLIWENIGFLTVSAAVEIFMNALIIALFVGLGLNINAFHMRNRDHRYRSLEARLWYIRDHTGSVLTFFVVPFCVSSASGIVVTGEGGNLVQGLFGTGSYLLIMAAGFIAFILLPALYVYLRHGWKQPD